MTAASVGPNTSNVFLTAEKFDKASQLPGHPDQLGESGLLYWVSRSNGSKVEGIFERIEDDKARFKVQLPDKKIGLRVPAIVGDAWGILELPTQHESIVGDSQEAIELEQKEADALQTLDEIREKRLAKAFSTRERLLLERERDLGLAEKSVELARGNVSSAEFQIKAQTARLQEQLALHAANVLKLAEERKEVEALRQGIHIEKAGLASLKRTRERYEEDQKLGAPSELAIGISQVMTAKNGTIFTYEGREGPVRLGAFSLRLEDSKSGRFVENINNIRQVARLRAENPS